jgi:uncharacterized protein YjbI with pentapeptide repeats
MANPEHLEILRQGVDAWNHWRDESPETRPDLSGVDLATADLFDAHLNGTDFSGTNLFRTDLKVADLIGARFTGANLFGSDLRKARLGHANLQEADLSDADITAADLEGADLSNTIAWSTIFGALDLSRVRGLETVRHEGPSTIGIDTIYLSNGNIPEVFLRGAGVPEEFIVYMRSLVGKAIDYYSCFISYSSKDDDFARRLHADLQQANVRCWKASEDLKIGDKFRTRIDESIRVHDKLMVILTEHSIASAWVEEEVEAALEKERKSSKLVLFPVRLDDAVMETDQAWAASLRRTRHIGDFRNWKDHDAFKKAFERLLRHLKNSD